MNHRIRLGISTCLLGEKVRFDGGHKFNPYLNNVLGDYVDYIPVCAEVESGLPTPRQALRLIRSEAGTIKLVFSRSGEEQTEQMESWCRQRMNSLNRENLDGFVFMSKSPSCGMERVKVYDTNGIPKKDGVGIFARIFMEHFPGLPVEEEGRLNDPKLRENFIAAVFTLKRLREMVEHNPTPKGLVDFHTRHKLLLLAHHEKSYRAMGRLVAQGGQLPFADLVAQYRDQLMPALRYKTTIKKHINVLQHIMGYFKHDLSTDEKHELLELIEQYRRELVPLIVPITLLNHFVRKYDQSYLKQQIYLQPHPKELKLLNHV